MSEFSQNQPAKPSILKPRFVTKIMALVGTTVVLTGAVIILWTNQEFHAALVTRYLDQVGVEAQIIGARLSTNLGQIAQDVHLLAGTPPTQGLIRAREAGGIDPIDGTSEETWKRRLTVIFSEMLKAKPQYLQLRIIGIAGNGREVLRVDRKDGQIYIRPENALQAKGRRAYFREAVRLPAHMVYFSEVELNRENEIVVKPFVPVIRVAIPLKNSSGEDFGILIINADIRWYFQKAQKNLRPGHILYFTNHRGEFLFHPDPDETFGFEFGRATNLQMRFPSLAEFFNEVSTEETPLIHTDLDNQKVIGIHKITIGPQNSRRTLGIAIEGTYGDLVSEAISVRNETIVISLFLLGVTLLMALLFSRTLTRPLLMITRAIETFGKGAKKVELPVTRHDEIGILAQTLNDMTTKIDEAQKILMRREAEVRHILESTPIGLLMVGKNGVIKMINSEAEKMFGYSREELLGTPVEHLIPHRYRDLHSLYRETFLGNPENRSMGVGRELFGLRKDCTEFPVEIGLNPIKTDEGQLVLASIIDISERIHAAQRLMNSLKEKEVLLKEVHHRVKNNLAVIGSLFYLQSTTTRDEETLRILQDCQDRVRSMALVHERLYRSEDLASVDFAEYTEELASHLFRNSALSPHTIGLKIDFEKIPLEIDQAIPCGLILTELISNALKHAFPNGRSGEIRVSLKRVGNEGVVLTVADNGVGLPEEPDLQDQRSLGMRLIYSLANQLDAKIEFLRREPGTEARLILEVSHVHAS